MSIASAKIAGDVPEWTICELPYLRAWREFIGIGRPELAQETGISLSMLVIIERRGQRVRGRYVNRIAAGLSVPASILLAHTPLDRPARQYARKAAIAAAARRLASVG